MIELGKEGEHIAERYLLDNGYIILDKNYRSPFGEIDIIAKIENEIVFVEVKTSKDSLYGYPEERVKSKKLDCIRKTALDYIYKHEASDANFRFDLISVIKDSKHLEIEHFKNIMQDMD